MSKKILIVNYEIGNVDSAVKAVRHLGYDAVFSSKKNDFEDAASIILPGQGSFNYAMKKIHNLNIEKNILKSAAKGTPILGICLGMQILAGVGFENNIKTNGLNLIEGEVIKFNEKNLRLPHVGWNEVHFINENKLFKGIENDKDFYFAHSFKFITKDEKNIIASTKYRKKFASIINKGNIYGVQFHPEKSLTVGLKLLKNFLDS